MKPVLELISRVGPSEANVLVTGENGTGKGTVAQAIHSVSGRTGKGLVSFVHEPADPLIARSKESSQCSRGTRQDVFKAILPRSHEVRQLVFEFVRRDRGIGHRAEASVVKSDGFADRPASSVEQVIEEILR